MMVRDHCSLLLFMLARMFAGQIARYPLAVGVELLYITLNNFAYCI